MPNVNEIIYGAALLVALCMLVTIVIVFIVLFLKDKARGKK